MEVEIAYRESDYEGAHGACIACLVEQELDSDGLCSACNPLDQETRDALINLLKPTKEAKPQGNN